MKRINFCFQYEPKWTAIVINWLPILSFHFFLLYFNIVRCAFGHFDSHFYRQLFIIFADSKISLLHFALFAFYSIVYHFFSFVIQLFPFSAFTRLNFLTSCNKLWTFLSIYICTFIASLHVFKQTNFQLFVQSLCSFQIVIFTIYWLYIFLFFHFSWSLRFFLVAIDYLTFRIKWKMFIHFYL